MVVTRSGRDTTLAHHIVHRTLARAEQQHGQITYHEVSRMLIDLAQTLGLQPSEVMQIIRHEVQQNMPDLQIELQPYRTGALRGHSVHGETFVNNPATTQATGMAGGDAISHEHGEPRNMGAAGIEEGAEQQAERPKKIWRRFPNTENAALKYVWTTYWEDTVFSGSSVFASLPAFQPFGQNALQTTTSLLTTGGGAMTTPNIDSIGNNVTGTNPRGGHDFSYPMLIQLKMTSPYGVVGAVRGTNLRLPSTPNTGQPNWLELFDTKYQYYHVLETEWEVTFYFGRVFNQTNSAGTFTYTDKDPKDCGYYIFWKYTNEDDPPTAYTITNNMPANIADSTAGLAPDSTVISSTTGVLTTPGATINQGARPLTSGTLTAQCTPDDYFRMGGWKHKHVMLSNIHDRRVTISGVYKYGQCKMDIKTISPNDAHGNDTAAEGWTKSGAQPAFPENLSIIIVSDNAMYAGGQTTTNAEYTQVSTRIETEQLTQFKDLEYPYKFPTPSNVQLPTSTSFNTDAVFFSKGALYT